MPSILPTIKVDNEILLRLPHPGDAAGLFALIDQNRQHLAEWLGYIQTIRSVEDVERFIAGRLRDAEDESAFEFLIEYRESVVGRIWISRLKEFENTAEISYWLAGDATGTGIMTRSCSALLRWLFEERKVNRVEIRAASANKKSTALPERLGFKLEGYLRDGTVVNGKYHDNAVYSMLAREWFAQ